MLKDRRSKTVLRFVFVVRAALRHSPVYYDQII